MEIVIVFLARYLVWVILAWAVVMVGLDLWRGTSRHQRPLTRVKSANWRKVGFILLAFLLAFLLAQLLHLLPVEYYRPYQIIMTRPLVMPSPDTPFPSDHAMFAFALSFAVIFMTRWRKIGLIGLGLAVAVGIGRVWALVHSPLDIGGGFICAAVGAAVWYYLYYRETPKHLPSDVKKVYLKVRKELPNLVKNLMDKLKSLTGNLRNRVKR
jgi:membrane-associated phospholipid phosphatase